MTTQTIQLTAEQAALRDRILAVLVENPLADAKKAELVHNNFIKIVHWMMNGDDGRYPMTNENVRSLFTAHKRVGELENHVKALTELVTSVQAEKNELLRRVEAAEARAAACETSLKAVHKTLEELSATLTAAAEKPKTKKATKKAAPEDDADPQIEVHSPEPPPASQAATDDLMADLGVLDPAPPVGEKAPAGSVPPAVERAAQAAAQSASAMSSLDEQVELLAKDVDAGTVSAEAVNALTAELDALIGGGS
uniref:Uncharacterized protein n=1 Tax=Podoviridae sp. ctlpi2 TaxID=2826574 RepID=A0A8S5MMF7_9CAUD|nr:MAG TPA: hypothetical protein [Podoviridae sp. ctlpi2]